MLESTLNNNTRIVRRARLTGYMKSLVASVIALLVSMPAAYATYNANLSGTVNAVLTYTSGTLLFSLSNQPTSNGSCNSIASDKEHQPGARQYHFYFTQLCGQETPHAAIHGAIGSASRCLQSCVRCHGV